MNIYHNDDIPDDLKKYFQPAPQIGLEKTPEEYVEKLVAVFREVRRVLKKDGVCFVNLGDSYAAGGGNRKNGSQGINSCVGHTSPENNPSVRNKPSQIGLKPKDLVGIPWSVAFALRADGWWLRQDIIWSKPNPMPESVKDRCTKSHEYIFLLTKSAKYYWDQDSVAEKIKESSIKRLSQNIEDQEGSSRVPFKTNGPMKAVMRKYNNNKYAGGSLSMSAHYGNSLNREDGLRNIRSVWTVATQPTKEAHFATYPEKLVETCIKAGSRIGDIVLDPFGGSGTTGRVAKRMNRQAVLIELNPNYIEIKQEVLDQQRIW